MTGTTPPPTPAGAAGRPLDWDAAAYQRQSTPQQKWGEEVLSRLRLRGDETILDLGCGAGAVTEQLLGLVPRGRVVGVDASARMIAAAAARLGDRAELVQADLRTFGWPGRADVVVSTATLHWVPDHAALWRRVRAMLVPGGRLETQYGGAGNIAAVTAALPGVCRRPPYVEHLGPDPNPWTFDGAQTARRELDEAGFTSIRVWTQARTARPPDVREFLATAILPSHLHRLPAPVRADFVDTVYAELGTPDTFEYVRLNVSAVR